MASEELAIDKDLLVSILCLERGPFNGSDGVALYNSDKEIGNGADDALGWNTFIFW